MPSNAGVNEDLLLRWDKGTSRTPKKRQVDSADAVLHDGSFTSRGIGRVKSHPRGVCSSKYGSGMFEGRHIRNLAWTRYGISAARVSDAFAMINGRASRPSRRSSCPNQPLRTGSGFVSSQANLSASSNDTEHERREAY